MSIRKERIAEQIRAEIARVLREESNDPRIGLLSITRVKLSADLSQALIFWSPLATDVEVEALEAMADGLDSAAGFVRGKLSANLTLRRTPALRFEYDPSIEQGSETLALLRSLEIPPERPEQAEEEGAPGPDQSGAPMEERDGETT